MNHEWLRDLVREERLEGGSNMTAEGENEL
jgi:hypothetical protein